MPRVVVLGLDGATFDVIKPLVLEGKLPHFSKLLNEGCCHELGSTVPAMSFPAWSSFLTGTNPGRHGIYDFMARRPHSYESQFINATWRKADSFAKILSEAGRRVALLSVPLTYPPEQINGVVISGFDAPGIGGVADASAIHPPGLRSTLRQVVGEYPISANLEALSGGMLLSGLDDTMSRKAKAALHLYKGEPWDCFVLVLGETDAVAHHFWSHYDPRSPLRDQAHRDPVLGGAIESIYRRADTILGEFLACLGDDTTLLVMSDHGHGGNGAKGISLNRWLQRQGLLRYRATGEGGWGGGGWHRRLARSVLNLCKSFGLKVTPVPIKKLLIRRTRIASRMESWLRFSHLDWRRTQVYSEEGSYPSLWLNVRGREPMGVVEPGAYESLRDDVVRRLREWSDPESNRKVVNRVYRREEIYQGPYTSQAPDLTIEWNLDDGYSYVNRRSTGPGEPIFSLDGKQRTGLKSGYHRNEGILMAYGSRVRAHSELRRPTLIDLAPTILYLAGAAVPGDMDGRILEEMIEGEYRSTHPVLRSGAHSGPGSPESEVTYTEEEAELIKSRLRALGYIE